MIYQKCFRDLSVFNPKVHVLKGKINIIQLLFKNPDLKIWPLRSYNRHKTCRVIAKNLLSINSWSFTIQGISKALYTKFVKQVFVWCHRQKKNDQKKKKKILNWDLHREHQYFIWKSVLWFCAIMVRFSYENHLHVPLLSAFSKLRSSFLSETVKVKSPACTVDW